MEASHFVILCLETSSWWRLLCVWPAGRDSDQLTLQSWLGREEGGMIIVQENIVNPNTNVNTVSLKLLQKYYWWYLIGMRTNHGWILFQIAGWLISLFRVEKCFVNNSGTKYFVAVSCHFANHWYVHCTDGGAIVIQFQPKT